jgi:hypothetical protein
MVSYAPAVTSVKVDESANRELPDGQEIDRFRELVDSGRVIAILTWADSMLDQFPAFDPLASQIETFCKTLNFAELRRLAEGWKTPVSDACPYN